MQRLKEKVQGVVGRMRPIQPTIPEFPALKRPPADLLRADLPTRKKAELTASSDSPPGQEPADDEDAWIDDEDEWEPGERKETADTAAKPEAARERAAIPPPPSKTAEGNLVHHSVRAAPQSGSAEPEDEDEDEWEPDDDDSIPGVTLVHSACAANPRASDRPPASRDELTEEFFSTPPEPEPTDFSDIDSLAAAAMKIDPKRQEMARKVVIGVMSSMAFLLVVSAGIAALGRGDDRASVQAAPSAVHGNLSAAAELAASRAPSTITYRRAEAEAARQNTEAAEFDEDSDKELEPPSKLASPEEVAAYRRALARKMRIKAAKRRPRPTGSSGGMLRRF